MFIAMPSPPLVAFSGAGLEPTGEGGGPNHDCWNGVGASVIQARGAGPGLGCWVPGRLPLVPHQGAPTACIGSLESRPEREEAIDGDSTIAGRPATDAQMR